MFATEPIVYAHEGCIPRDEHFGRRIGDYVCYSRLGRGGYGEVFLAYEPANSRVWAIKTAIQGPDENGVKRFRREAKLPQMLRHRNIVHCVGSGGYGTMTAIGSDRTTPRSSG